MSLVMNGPNRRIAPVGWWELFENRASARPGDIALVCGEERLSFQELDLWSNRLARALIDAGAGPGTVVASAMSRSPLAISNLLAIAKTGATYLPLDLGAPAARVSTILADADATVLVTDDIDDAENEKSPLAARGQGETRLVFSSQHWRSELANYDEQRLPRAAGPAAYIVYTSGSTGRPKGVVVGHRSLTNVYQELSERFFPFVGRADAKPARVAHALPFAFDASWNPILWMAGGHQLHLVTDEVRTDSERYVELIREHRISVLEGVPSHIAALIDAGLLDSEVKPRLVLMGGEPVSTALWQRLRGAAGLTAVNLYGPTECTVFTTACVVGERTTPAIGRPIANTHAILVDTHLRPVPSGEPGELLIGGECLALTYLHQPALTMERFVSLECDAQRWYRTGDLCRQLPDGHLEYLGRTDDQIKIRGHRVEPGDTEHALSSLPGVDRAVVRAEGEGAALRLVAYVAVRPESRAEITPDTLRAALRKILPEYLVPQFIVSLDAMPLGPNGKIDRRALPASVPPAPAGAERDPMTPAQEIVAAAFCVVLGRSDVTAQSHFFELGGHSLSAVALAARLRAQGVPCALHDVFRLGTVSKLAALVPERSQLRLRS